MNFFGMIEKNNNGIHKQTIFIRFFIICLFILLIAKQYSIDDKIDNFFSTKHSTLNGNLTFNLSNYKSYYSPELNLVKITYLIQFFDSNDNAILPSDLNLYYKLHIFCFLDINKINITSLASIESDKYFKCVEFFNADKKIKFGFFIYMTKNQKEKIYVNIKNIFKYQYDTNEIFHKAKIDLNHNILLSQIKNENSILETKKLKKLYISKPFYTLKRDFIKKENQWTFVNLYNEYFCFCKGSNCLNVEISKICKYKFYLYLIDKNHHTYKKNEFLLMDFIFKRYCSADVYPIFEVMINRNISAHYLTEREDLYEKYYFVFEIKACSNFSRS